MKKIYLKYMTVCSIVGTLSVPIVLLAKADIKSKRAILEVKTSTVKKQDSTQINPLDIDSIPWLMRSQRSLSADRLDEIPVLRLENTLSGRLAGLNTVHQMGGGNEGATLSLRQRSPLVIIDGAVRDLESISAQDVASISVVTDPVLLANYGMRGANGVLYVKTKVGREGKPSIQASYQRAVKQALYLPRYLGAYQFALLANEASRNGGRADIYSAEALAGYRDHSDAYRYPDVSWYDTALKQQQGFGRLDLNVSGGGGKFARYYLGLQSLDQEGIFKEGDKDFNTNNTQRQYGFRSNVEIDIDKNFRVGLKLAGRFDQSNSPGAGVTSIFTALDNTPAGAYPIFNKDGSLFGNAQYTQNIHGQLYETGFVKNSRRTIFIDADFSRKLDFLTEGLMVTGAAHYSSFYDWAALRNRSSYAIYQPQQEIDNGKDYLKLRDNTSYANAGNYGNSFSRRYNYDFGFSYKKQLSGSVVTADLRYNWDQFDIGTSLTHAYQAIRGQIAYVWKNKFDARVSAAWEGTEQYPRGSRYGFFPAISVGYDLAQDAFLSHSVFDRLRVKASYGLLGDDRATNFAYQSYFSPISNAYYFGATATGLGGWDEVTLGNPNITWEKNKMMNIGLQGSLWNNSLTFGAEYYQNRRYDVLQVRGKSNALLGESFPPENIAKYDYDGIVLDAGFKKVIGAVTLNILANAQFQFSKVRYIDELPRLYDYQVRTGQRIGQLFGLIADGLFQAPAEIQSSPSQFEAQLEPGDIKYRDLNGDGVVNEDDVTAIGSKKMPRFYTLNLGADYKNFDIQLLFNAVTNTDFSYTGDRVWEFRNNGNVQEHHLGRWTAETAGQATYPRLSYGNNVNNHQLSTYWLKKGDYLRLKNIQMGYTFRSALLQRVRIQHIRLFAGAYNLWTLSSLDNVDPESGFSNYPTYRSYNLGLNFKF